MAATQEIEQAAKHAAERVRQLLVEMLLAGERGEVAVEVTATGLQPIKRKEERKSLIKVAVGHATD